MPATLNTKNVVETKEEQDRVAKANLLRAQSRAAKAGVIGYIIHSPAYGTPLGATLGKVVLQIHRHPILVKKGKKLNSDGITDDEIRVYPGKELVGLDGEWFTTDKDAANYAQTEYGPSGYTVTEVRNDATYGLLGSAEYLKAKAIMSGSFNPDEDDDEDDAELFEEHPDTPHIVSE